MSSSYKTVTGGLPYIPPTFASETSYSVGDIVVHEYGTFKCTAGVDASSNTGWDSVSDNFVSYEISTKRQFYEIWEDTNTAVVGNYAMMGFDNPTGGSNSLVPKMFYDIYTSAPADSNVKWTRESNCCIWANGQSGVYTSIYLTPNRDDFKNSCIVVNGSGKVAYRVATAVKSITASGGTGDDTWFDRVQDHGYAASVAITGASMSMYKWMGSSPSSFGFISDIEQAKIDTYSPFSWWTSASQMFFNMNPSASGGLAELTFGSNYAINSASGYYAGSTSVDLVATGNVVTAVRAMMNDIYTLNGNAITGSSGHYRQMLTALSSTFTYNYPVSNSGRMYGPVGCLIDKIGEIDPYSSVTGDHRVAISANTPSLFFNAFDSSYYVRCEVSSMSSNGSSEVAYPGLNAVSYYDTFIPSYRFMFDYRDASNRYATRAVFSGYKPIPVDREAITDSAVKNNIDAVEASYIKNVDYSVEFSDMDFKTFAEWPMIITDDNNKFVDGCFCTGGVIDPSHSNVPAWIAYINNVEFVSDDSVTSDNGATSGKRIKSADFYYFDATNGNSGYDPYVSTRAYVPWWVFQQKSIKAPIRPGNLDKNLHAITGMAMNELSDVDEGSRYEFNYLFRNGYSQANNGKILLSRYPGTNPITAAYSDEDAEINIVNGIYTIPLSTQNGNLQNIIVNHGEAGFEAFKADNSYRLMVVDDEYSNGVKTSITNFFNSVSSYVPSITAANLYFKDSVYDSIEITSETDSLGPLDHPIYEGTAADAVYLIDDSIDWDVSIVPKFSNEQISIMERVFGAGFNPSELISGTVKGKWYMWLDKTSNVVGSGIKLDIIDCRGRKSDGEWISYGIDDVTEKLVAPNGDFVLPENAVPFEVESDDQSVDRIKIRFRLYVNDDSVYLDPAGYRIVLGYRVETKNGYKDFVLHENRTNPYPKICNRLRSISDEVTKRSYCVFINGKCDHDKPRGGMVYDITGASDVKVSMDATVQKDSLEDPETIGKLVNRWWPETSFETRIYGIDDDESGDGISSITNNGTYYIVTKWDETGFVISEGVSIKVRHRVGSYYCKKSESDYYFRMGTNDEVRLKDFYAWNGTVYTHSTFPSDPDENEKVLNNDKSSYGNDEPLEIYDLWDGSGTLQYKLRVKCTVRSGTEYQLCVGDTERVGLDFSSDLSDSSVVINPDWLETDGHGNKFIRVYLTKNGGYNEIPDMYETYEEVAVDDTYVLVYDSAYYEINGGICVKFRPYEKVNITIDVRRSPDIDGTDKTFYIVNGFKIFGIGATYTVNGQIESGESDGIMVNRIKTEWRCECFDNDGNMVWDSGDGYVYSMNNNQAKFRVGVTRYDPDVGLMPYEAENWKLRFTGKYAMTYDIVIGGVAVKTVDTNSDGGDKIIVEDRNGVSVFWFDPIKVSVEPQLYFMNPVIGYHDIAVIINETDNRKGIYSSYDLDMDCGVVWNGIPASAKMIRDPMNFSYDMETVGNVRGNLTESWKKNDEGLEWITSINHPVLFVVNKEDYQEGVNRVIDGQKLKYPYSRKDVLMPPNEWVTAENVNHRFDLIAENLRYLAKQTKVYSKPPIKYCGYYGDFMSNENGSYSRIYGGYVPVTDIVLYRKYNERTSIDDNETAFRGIKSMCVDVGDYDLGDIVPDPGKSYQSYSDECADNNMYVCLGDRIKIVNGLTYIQNLSRADIVPKKINEFMDDITRVAYSTDTGLLYCLSTRTHKVYIFNQYKNMMIGDPQNASYYGEIGGYGGPYAVNKFNNPTDLFISTVKDGDESHDEIWVCDTGNNVIKHYTIKGQWINTIDLSVLDDFKVVSICSDYKNRIFVLTGTHVFVFDADGVLKYVFELHEKLQAPKLIRPQYNAEFIYVLYDHFVEKYTSDGEYISKFAENEELTYTSMCPDRKHNLYIGTNKNILHYCDGLRVMELGQTENADDFKWKMDEIYLKRNENIQDSVLNTSLQRMYDNIQMYSICIFGRIIDVVSNEDEDRVSDVDYVTRNDILDEHHKERIFVGVNELVTSDTINRSFELMYDLLEKVLSSI